MTDRSLSSVDAADDDDGAVDGGGAGGGPVATPSASSSAPYFMSLAGQLGVGGMLGYSAGHAAKEIGRRVMYYAGLGVLALQVLQYNRVVKVHWGTLFSFIEGGLDTDGDGKFTGVDVNAWFQRFMRIVSAGVPGSASFCAGVYLGLRS
jgi:uncharacterized membrane protein (Fun14 family)